MTFDQWIDAHFPPRWDELHPPDARLLRQVWEAAQANVPGNAAELLALRSELEAGQTYRALFRIDQILASFSSKSSTGREDAILLKLKDELLACREEYLLLPNMPDETKRYCNTYRAVYDEVIVRIGELLASGGKGVAA